MIELIVYGTIAIMIVIAFAANMALPEADSLPMHFNIRFRPTWSAPRMIALLSIPLIMAITMICMSVFLADDPEILQAISFMAPLAIAAQIIHIVLIARHLKQQD